MVTEIAHMAYLSYDLDELENNLSFLWWFDSTKFIGAESELSSGNCFEMCANHAFEQNKTKLKNNFKKSI
jgi:hypothetical protein